MVDDTLICDATLADGTICGRTAFVRGSHYEYASNFGWKGGGAFKHSLVETRYDIECPRCGQRAQVERPDVR